MTRLAVELTQLCKNHPEGSPGTQRTKLYMVLQFERQLAERFDTHHMGLQDLKGRHINHLLECWRANGNTAATIKNKMVALRWVFGKIGKAEVVKSNSDLGIPNRVYVTNENKAHPLAPVILSPDAAKPADMSDNIWASVRLQAHFGLRRKESIKFIPRYALDRQTVDNAAYIKLKDTWGKGGRPRVIPIETAGQRALLRELMDKYGSRSLIPKGSNYYQQQKRFERETHAAGLGQSHGLRHDYSHRGFEEKTGRICRAKAGEDRKLTIEEKQIEKEARFEISHALGHSRLGITSNYLGPMGK